jgi:uncharacterized protein YfaP (DUF2135 family)
MKIRLATLALSLSALCASPAADAPSPPARAPASLELHDQYDQPQRLAFPATNVVVLTIADQKGSAQIDAWVTEIKARYAGRLDLRGLADVRGVPGFLRGKVRKKFQETRRYPVMMDWSGTVCSQFGFQPGAANVLVLGPDGAIQARLAGPARADTLEELFTVLDRALSNIHISHTNPTARLSPNPKP